MVALSARRVKLSLERSMPNAQVDERDPRQLVFHPKCGEEYNIPRQFGNQFAVQWGHRPKYFSYSCGTCGRDVEGRVLCDVTPSDDGPRVLWCMCAKNDPTVILEKDGSILEQYPTTRQHHANRKWPQELIDLYEEAARSFAAGAPTACAMVCRKILMVTSCNKGERDGKKFFEYVDHITNSVLQFPDARAAIAKIKDIGNDANHDATLVSSGDAKQALDIVTYMLNTIYALPGMAAP
jgi:hypothetical protein